MALSIHAVFPRGSHSRKDKRGVAHRPLHFLGATWNQDTTCSEALVCYRVLENSNWNFGNRCCYTRFLKTRPRASRDHPTCLEYVYNIHIGINYRLLGVVMKSKTAHFLTGFAGTVGYLLVTNIVQVEWWSIPRSISLWIIFSFLTDGDTEFNHRNFLFHSLAFPFLFTISFWGIPNTSFSLFVVGLHLLCDIYSKKPRGFYCIHFWKGCALSVRQTRWWLGILGLAGIMASILLEVS